MSHYLNWSYVDERRFSSFYIQISEALLLKPTSILEVGVGSGVVRDILQNRSDVSMITVDIQAYLFPSVVGSVVSLPLYSKSVDVVMCCQVLEHLDFSCFQQALLELGRVARHGVVLSLPDCEPYYSLRFDLPLFGKGFWSWTRKRKKTLNNKGMNPSHLWEIGRNGITVTQVHNAIQLASMSILKEARNSYYPYHHFFVLRP